LPESAGIIDFARAARAPDDSGNERPERALIWFARAVCGSGRACSHRVKNFFLAFAEI
jgi:hypothetical protein